MELEEEDEENRDWWTKYFASLEAVVLVSVGGQRGVLEIIKVDLASWKGK